MRCFVDAIRASALCGKRVSTKTNGRRAAIAAIFSRTETDEEQLLFIRRAISEKDRWSGDVALPGGKQDAVDDGDDEKTAIRETLEEVGIDLSRGELWEPLGRLIDDRVIGPDRHGKTLAISIFGFVARHGASSALPKLSVQASEVADAWWVETRHLRASRLGWRFVPLSRMVRDRPIVASLFRSLGCEHWRFAAIDLPPPPNVALPLAEPQHYQLWGLTLAFLSDVLRTTGLDTPLVGEGAPAEFRAMYGPTRGGMLAACGFKVLELAQQRGSRQAGLAIAAAGMATATAVGLLALRGLSWALSSF
jgi:8-oxo-dGTP pyrophosphatase MutT (NUDIX family)